MPEKKLTIALTGNPNSGKTTVFNAITGSRQHVGNYPGVTVELKEGSCLFEGYDITIVDLPGTYSLTAHSIDEVVARNYLVDENPDVVVDVVDAGNLERNLYLATQLVELDVRLVLAFNMSDMAQARGHKFDYEQLSELIGIPIVPTTAHKGRGIDDLLHVAVETATKAEVDSPSRVHFQPDFEAAIAGLVDLISREHILDKFPARWLAIKLLEGDADIRRTISASADDGEHILKVADHSVERLRKLYRDTPEIVIAEDRYGFISGVCEEGVLRTVESRHDMSDHIDKVVTNRLLGLPIFLFLMWLVFQLTFKLGNVPMRLIEMGFAWVGGFVSAVLPQGHLQSLIVDGVIGGVGGVLVFLPSILLVFLAIAFLEDTGYMARGVFIMDRIMHTIGLHGRSFIPFVIGFGCSVPAILATRTLENRRDRFVTILVTPLMSCSARLPVYVLLAGAFFSPERSGSVIFSVYLIGILLAIVVARSFRRYLFAGPSTPLVMELPPYRIPTLRSLLLHMWIRGWMYLKKAGTVILGMSVLIWILCTFPVQPDSRQTVATATASTVDNGVEVGHRATLGEEQLRSSYAGSIGRAIAPVLKPIGLGNWKIGTALFAGLGGKELVVSTFGTLYSLGDTGDMFAKLKDSLREDLTPLKAYSLMIFILIYIPCVATVAVIRQETNSWGWALFAVVYTTVLAWLVSLAVYQGGRLLGPAIEQLWKWTS